MSDFATALDAIEGVEGWLSPAQALRLWEAGARVRPPGRVVEIGSFRGRSAVMLASGASAGVEIVAIDPHAGSDRGPQEIAPEATRGAADFDAFHANLARAGVAERVRHVRAMSSEALDAVSGPLDVLFVDGAHRFAAAREDIVRWGERLAPGGRLLVHDAFSSIGVTLALMTSTTFSRDLRYLGRSGSLAEWVREPLGGAAARARNAARQLAELPWFARNVLVKVSLVTGLRPLARALGHDSGDWPY